METETLEQSTKVSKQAKLEKLYPEKGKIVIRAKNPKKQLPVVCRPCEDETGRVFTGQGSTGHYETLSEQERRTLSYVVTPDTSVTLVDGKVINLGDPEKGDEGNPVDKANWPWLRKHPYLALTKQQAKASRDAVFYIEDPVSEAENRVKESKTKDKVRYLIQYSLDLNKLKRTAMLLGNLATDTLSPTELQDYLLQQADVIPQVVLDAIEPENESRAKAKIFLVEMTKYRAIQRGDGGLFRFGGPNGIPLGHTEETVLDFLLDTKNADTVSMMKTNLAELKGIAK